ncbi:MAG: hypothetical protein P4M11_06560 [Candidatus Pacebacteria bacterium]|nr:hypothetical protein [Candidatus Paceibacterota bacterium]
MSAIRLPHIKVYHWWELVVGSSLFLELFLWLVWTVVTGELFSPEGVASALFGLSLFASFLISVGMTIVFLANRQVVVPFWVSAIIFVALIGGWLSLGILAGDVAGVAKGLLPIVIYAFMMAGTAGLASLAFEPKPTQAPLTSPK